MIEDSISHIQPFRHPFFLLKHHFILGLLKVGMSHLNKKVIVRRYHKLGRKKTSNYIIYNTNQRYTLNKCRQTIDNFDR